MATLTLLLTLFCLGHAASNPVNHDIIRKILGQQRASDACSGIRCPDVSSCREVGGVPTCVCPKSFARLRAQGSSYVCSNRALANSEFIDQQQAARAAVGAPPLVWNRTMADLAAQWASKLKSSFNCQARIQGNRGGLGQNVVSQEIVLGFAPRISTPTAMNRWVRQGVNYTSLTAFNSRTASGCATGFWQDCSTYLQVVWQYTTQVGCAYAECGKEGQVWVCNYFSPGLIDSYYPFSPCYKTTCSGSRVCNPNLGTPPACRASPCNTVSCPRGAACALSPTVIPYCTCTGPEQAAVRDRCIAVGDPLEVVPQTSVAIFPEEKFGGTSFIFRAPIPTTEDPGCVNFPARLAKRTQSLEVIWNVGDEETSGATPQACTGLAFWPEKDCGGRGILYQPFSGFTTLVQSDAAEYVRIAQSVSCR